MSSEGPPKFDNFDFASAEKEKLSIEQRRAIKLSLTWAKEIQKAFPQIALDYINGIVAPEIVKKYNIQEIYGIESPELAVKTVHCAIRGSKGSYEMTGVQPFPGLIDDPEIRKILTTKHKKIGAVKSGKSARDKKLGMFSLSLEEHRQVGKRSGAANYQKKIGIHAEKTEEERKKLSREAIIARGDTPLSEDEKLLIQNLSSQPEYRINESKARSAKIAEEVNTRLHSGKKIRTSGSITEILKNLKKV